MAKFHCKSDAQKKAIRRNYAKKAEKNGAGVPIGRTIKTKDEYLPYDPKKVQELKQKRWIAVIDKNMNEELAIVRLTDERQPNTTPLPTYKKGNKRDTYFKHFVETEDSDGNAIRVDGKKFIENLAKYDLSAKDVSVIREKVLKHTRQSQENRQKIEQLKGKKKR